MALSLLFTDISFQTLEFSLLVGFSFFFCRVSDVRTLFFFLSAPLFLYLIFMVGWLDPFLPPCPAEAHDVSSISV